MFKEEPIILSSGPVYEHEVLLEKKVLYLSIRVPCFPTLSKSLVVAKNWAKCFMHKAGCVLTCMRKWTERQTVWCFSSSRRDFLTKVCLKCGSALTSRARQTRSYRQLLHRVRVRGRSYPHGAPGDNVEDYFGRWDSFLVHSFTAWLCTCTKQCAPVFVLDYLWLEKLIIILLFAEIPPWFPWL